MNIEEQLKAYQLELETIKSQFAYLIARINLIESRFVQQTMPLYDYDTLPKSADSSKAD